MEPARREKTPCCARLPLHDWHAACGARFRTSDGWQVPAAYASAESELAAARGGLAVADISAFTKIRLLGRGVPALAQALWGDGPATRPRGVARFTTAKPTWVCRLTEDQLLVLPFTTAAEPGHELTTAAQFPAVIQRDVTSAYAGFGIIGPLRERLLARLAPLDTCEAALPVGTCAETSLAGVHALLIPWAHSSPAGLWLYVAWDVAEYVWETLLESGWSLGVAPLGLDGLDLLLSAAGDVSRA